jgi:1-acyl-sn-glycerol-3-phosphate acyltransferase
MHIPLLSFPIIRSFINGFENDMARFGLQKSMRKVFEKVKTKLVVLLDDETEKVLENEAVIVVANHPNEIEPMALFAAMPSRNDAYIIVNEQFLNISPTLDRHLIPVYIQHVLDKSTKQQKRIKFIRTIKPVERISKEESKKKNMVSMEMASKKLEKGGLVLIFPGVELEDWYPGVARIINGIKTKKKIYIVNAYVSGTSKYDTFRVLPFVSSKLPAMEVSFSKPKEINNLIGKDLGNVLSELKNDYKKWVNKFI